MEYNSDGKTYNTCYTDRYYKSNYNKCYKCMDGCNECNNGKTCRTYHPEYSLINNECICNKETCLCPEEYIGKGCNKYHIYYYNENVNEYNL